MNALVGPALTPPWQRTLLPFAALMTVLLAIYWPTLQGMVAIWSRSETFAHAYVVPPISLWLIWRRRAELRECTPQPVTWMLLPLALAAALWMLGDLAEANAVAQIAFAALLVLTVPTVLGWQVTKVILFPLGFLFFAVPVGEALTPMLMQWTADFTVVALRASGIPVYREGQNFVIPTGSWSVVEACSGIRYLMASFMVGSLFAYLNYQSTRRRALFVLVSIVLPIVANWVRAYLIVMLGHLSNNTIAVGADHLLYGWVFFGIVIMAMFFIGARWSEPEVTRSGSSPAPPLLGTGNPTKAWSVALVGAMLLTVPQLALTRLVAPSDDTTPDLTLPPTFGAGWSAVESANLDTWQPAFVEASSERTRTYAGRGGQVGLYIAYYRAQSDTRKLVSSRNVLVKTDDYRWNHLASGQASIVLDGQALTLRTGELLAAAQPGQPERTHLVVWQYYWVGGTLTSSDALAKLHMAWQRLRGQGDESAAVLLYAADDGKGSAKPLLEAFLRDNHAAIGERLQQLARATR